MEPERLPIAKAFDAPFLSLDGTSVEMASLLFLSLAVIVISARGGSTTPFTFGRWARWTLAIAVPTYLVLAALMGAFGRLEPLLAALRSDESGAATGAAMPLITIATLTACLLLPRQRTRRVVQIASLLVFFYVVYSCLGVFGMIRNSLFGLTLIGSVYTESFYWMALPVVVLSATLLSGSVFCGWICPTGTMQDAATWVRRKIIRRPLQRPKLMLALLGLVLMGFIAALIALSVEKQLFIEDSSLHWAAALLLLCYLALVGVIDDKPTRGLRLVSVLAILFTAVSHLVVTSPVHFAFTSRSDPASALATVVLLVASLFVMRSWCRYLCPWGYLMGLLHRFSRLRIAKTDSLCNSCNSCERSCDVGAIRDGKVVSEWCQFCMACVDGCPTTALKVVDAWAEKAQQAGPAPAPVPGEASK